jgi:flagellar biosynthesis/type III secretory pathway M-ring protein FliF/YscJ
MNWISEEKTEKQVTAGAPISLLDSKTETTESQAPPVGAPGATANVPEAAVGLGQKTTISKTTELVENYDNSESLTKTRTEPGSVMQYYVSAFIEGAYDADGNYTGLTQPQVDNYKALITNAVGKGTLPTEIEVFDQAFRIEGRAAQPAPVAATFGLPWYEQPVIKWGIQGALIIAWRRFPRRVRRTGAGWKWRRRSSGFRGKSRRR